MCTPASSSHGPAAFGNGYLGQFKCGPSALLSTEWAPISQELKAAKANPGPRHLVFLGHSRGGAIATVAAAAVRESSLSNGKEAGG